MPSNKILLEVFNVFSNEINEHLEATNKLHSLEVEIVSFADHLYKLFNKKKKLLICGNGGSAADAQHFSSELVGRFEKERAGFPAFSLSTDTSTITAIGNDYGFENIFSRQIESIANEGDSLLVISTSGNSKNLINAVEIAKNKRLFVIGLLGNNGGLLKHKTDLNIIVPESKTSRIQEMHSLIIHLICKIIDLNASN